MQQDLQPLGDPATCLPVRARAAGRAPGIASAGCCAAGRCAPGTDYLAVARAGLRRRRRRGLDRRGRGHWCRCMTLAVPHRRPGRQLRGARRRAASGRRAGHDRPRPAALPAAAGAPELRCRRAGRSARSTAPTRAAARRRAGTDLAGLRTARPRRRRAARSSGCPATAMPGVPTPHRPEPAWGARPQRRPAAPGRRRARAGGRHPRAGGARRRRASQPRRAAEARQRIRHLVLGLAASRALWQRRVPTDPARAAVAARPGAGPARHRRRAPSASWHGRPTGRCRPARGRPRPAGSCAPGPAATRWPPHAPPSPPARPGRGQHRRQPPPPAGPGRGGAVPARSTSRWPSHAGARRRRPRPRCSGLAAQAARRWPRPARDRSSRPRRDVARAWWTPPPRPASRSPYAEAMLLLASGASATRAAR